MARTLDPWYRQKHRRRPGIVLEICAPGEFWRAVAELPMMHSPSTFFLLAVAACLEVGGDAVVRLGLKGAGGPGRGALLALGACVLFGYGVFVNSAPADFGRSLGVYVVLFFVVAQLVNAVAFGVIPGAGIIVGGALIVAGGAIITVWKT